MHLTHDRRPSHHRRLAMLLAASLLLAAPSGAEEAPAPTETDPALAAVDAFIAEANVSKGSTGWKTSLREPPLLPFAKDKTYWWRLETEVGSIRVKLMPDVAPQHVSSTLYLTRLGFFDGTVFHRIIPGFMAQGGDPLGTGRGGPGYRYEGEFSRRVVHDRAGLLSMANAGPGTDGSQFFLTFAPTPHLNGKHTIFGEVSGGYVTLERLEKLGSPRGTPKKRIAIERATIEVR